MCIKRGKYSPTEKAKIAHEAIKGELTMAQYYPITYVQVILEPGGGRSEP